MSRIYDNQPLSNLPLVNINVSEEWNSRKHESGNGVLFEGCIQKRAHFQICDCKKTKVQYYIFYMKIARAHKRKFDNNGTEVEPNFSETKKVNTGYLNSSYKVEARGETDLLDISQTLNIINKPELTKHTDKYGSPDLAAVWLHEEKIGGLEFECGDQVRVKTKGDGPFVFSISKLDNVSSSVSNYAGGESVGASWTDKIMDLKSNVPTSKENEGVDEDEWDD
ncbi:arpin-like [Ruditapes philippinarum]|uniref:arpin-like n=1 Tax=Ruditapes philippinarum TaxID=129788 RepID=UPI00295B9D53|nr:arpin-like [Ruditapes philippinarum]